jgi:GNAT superfamily N-acetyltransferase
MNHTNDTPNFQIRLAVIAEAPIIASILVQAFREYESLYTPEAFAVTTPTSEQIQRRWNEGPVWVAVQLDRIVGTVAAVPRGESLYIRSMAILPSARGEGIGRGLLQEAERLAVAHGFQRMILSTTPFLTHAIRLYEQFGFHRVSEGPQDLFGTPLFTMSRASP